MRWREWAVSSGPGHTASVAHNPHSNTYHSHRLMEQNINHYIKETMNIWPYKTDGKIPDGAKWHTRPWLSKRTWLQWLTAWYGEEAWLKEMFGLWSAQKGSVYYCSTLMTLISLVSLVLLIGCCIHQAIDFQNNESYKSKHYIYIVNVFYYYLFIIYAFSIINIT